MNKFIILNAIYFLSSYIIMFLIYLLIINRKRKDYNESKKQMEISYLVNKFNLDMRKVKFNKIKWILTFINPLIISIIFIIVINIDSLIIAGIVGFFTTIILTYSLYEIIGRSLKRKENKYV